MADRVRIDIDLARFNARIHRYVQASGRDADAAVLDVALNILDDTQSNWPVDSGESRASWIGPTRVGPGSYQLSNHTPQSPVIEYGAFRGLGPKTVQFGGATLPGGQQINAGIYSSQVPAAPLRRALSKNYLRMGQMLKAAMKKNWGR